MHQGSSLPTAFASAELKLQWAEEQLRELERRAFEISQWNAQHIEPREDPATGKRVFYLSHDPIVPPGFPLLTGVILQSLRSALDHLAYALCLAGRVGEPLSELDVRQVSFPIADGGAESYLSHRARAVLLRLAKPGVVELLDTTIQPYRGGHGELLAYLSTLNKIDKHRLLLTIALNSPARYPNRTKTFDPHQAAQLRMIRAITSGLGPFAFPFGPPLKAGAEVYREPADNELGSDLSFGFDIAFNEPEFDLRKPVVDVLYDIAGVVRGVALRFAPFA